MSYFLHLCDCSVFYCASLEAWNCVVAGQHLLRVTPGHQFGQSQVFLYFQEIISRPGQSQGLLYKQPCDWLIHWVSEPFPPTALRCRHTQTVRVSTSNYKIDYVIVVKNFLNPEGHQNVISGSKVTAILLKGLILPIGEASSGRVCVCSLRSRLVLKKHPEHSK